MASDLGSAKKDKPFMDRILEQRKNGNSQLDERLIHTVALIVILYLAVRPGNWTADRAVSNQHWRHPVRQLLRYSAATFALIAITDI